MRFGICDLSIVPLRLEPNDTSEMISQVLFGDYFKVLERRKKWSKIRLDFDNYEGWIDNKQFKLISEELYSSILNNPSTLAGEIIDFVTDTHENFYTIPIGCSLPFFENGSLKIGENSFSYDGTVLTEILPKENIIDVASKFLNAPYLWGGKTPFGMDCSGFVQVVFRMSGIELPRDAWQQAEQGSQIDFAEEARVGDLAFFGKENEAITHVGIVLNEGNIIHCSEKVKVEKFDHQGIHNSQGYTHDLRVIKRLNN